MEINIYTFRGKKVMLDENLAKIYGVETRILNQAIQRNKARFPKDYMFQLTKAEYSNLISQFVISSEDKRSIRLQDQESLRSQIVISKRGGRKYRPFVFTEHGTVMLASVLRSKRAIEMNIDVVNSFVKLKRAISSQDDILKQLSEVRTFILHNSAQTKRDVRKIWKTLDELTEIKDKSNKRIGFNTDKE